MSPYKKYNDIIWGFVMAEERYYDIKIVCSDGTIVTNKCFTAFFEDELSKLEELVMSPDQPIIVIVPDICSQEVTEKTSSFSMKLHADPSIHQVTQPKPNTNSLKVQPSTFAMERFFKNKTLSNEESSQSSNNSSVEQYKSGTNESSNSSVNRRNIGTSKCCHSCGKVFDSALKLAKHSYHVHSKEQDDNNLLKCSICFKIFQSKHKFSLHMRRTHSCSQFTCKICNMKYSRKDNMLAHYERAHNKC